MSAMLSLLREVRQRKHIAMYVGATSILKFADFLRGYDYGIEKLGHGPDPTLENFRAWMQNRFDNDKSNWEEILLQQCGDDAAALARFWDLLDEFITESKLSMAADSSTSKSDSIKISPVSKAKSLRKAE